MFNDLTGFSHPFFTQIISAHILTAISPGVSDFMSSPAGMCILLLYSSILKPSLASLSSIHDALFLLHSIHAWPLKSFSSSVFSDL